MFLSSKLINALKKDHDILRTFFNVLKEDVDMSELKKAFLKLAPELEAHTKSEEDVVYRFMLTKTDLRPLALEGQEEHRRAEQLLIELDNEFLNYDERWQAKAKVLGDLLEHHINEEEAEVFPELKKHLTSELDEQLYKKYEKANVESRDTFVQTPRPRPTLGIYSHSTP